MPAWRSVLRRAARWAHLWLAPNAPHHPEGDFGIDADGCAVHDAPQRRTWASVGLFRAAMFTGVAVGTQLPLRPLLERGIAERRISAEPWDGEWTDVGTPERSAGAERLNSARRSLLSRRAAPRALRRRAASPTRWPSNSALLTREAIACTTSACTAIVFLAIASPLRVRRRRRTRASAGSTARCSQPRCSSDTTSALTWLLAVKQRAANACWLSPGSLATLASTSCSAMRTSSGASRSAITSSHNR